MPSPSRPCPPTQHPTVVPLLASCTSDLSRFLLSCALVTSLLLASVSLFAKRVDQGTPGWVYNRRPDSSACPQGPPGSIDLSSQTAIAIALGSAVDAAQGKRPLGPHPDPKPDDGLFKVVDPSHFPIARGVCGSWVGQYMEMQAASVAERVAPGGLQEQRVAVAITDDDGLSDRLFTITTVFLTALLSNRAFLNNFQAGYTLSEAMTSSYIDWSFQRPVTPNVTFDYYEPLMSGKKKKLLREMLWLRDFTAMGARADNVVWKINSGAVMLAFDNPAVHCKLVQMGLNRENLFPCLFDFLFRPTLSTLNLYPTELQVLQDPDIVKIGIQIREGDNVFQRAVSSPVFSPNSKTLAYFAMYFDCAIQLEKQYYERGAKKVVWYVVSDSVDIRRLAVEQYGADRVLTNLAHALDHTLLPYSPGPASQAHFQKTAAIAAGEMWLFSLADAHIVTEKSGYGRLGALLSMRNRTYSIRKQWCWRRHECVRVQPRSCSLDAPDTDVTDTVWF